MASPIPEPRETARQIAKQYVDECCFEEGERAIRDALIYAASLERVRILSDDRLYVSLESQVASLTADLAQAKEQIANLQSNLKWMKLTPDERLSDELVANAKLINDLAQARQNEIETAKRLSDVLSGGNASEWDHIFDAAEKLKAQLAAAEQALDEALKAEQVYGIKFGRMEGETAEDHAASIEAIITEREQAIQSAARTALLEAAADMKQRHDTFLGIEIAQWLTTRAGGPRT